ncbi:S-adenosyl-L-methionine-dependent methyltransferase [Aspergillus crustosus]
MPLACRSLRPPSSLTLLTSMTSRAFHQSTRKMASDWSANQYLKFEAERTRPSRDLLAQVPLRSPTRVVDLGCGPGNSTAVLLSQFPDARVTGIDSSPDMIKKARATLPEIEFSVEDLATYSPQEPVDVFFSNAVFQWLPRSERLQIIKRLMEAQPSGGVFAFQVPDNLTEPSHIAMRETAADGPWASTLGTAGRDTFQTPQEIYDELKPVCADVNVWHTHYYHSLESHKAVVDWVKGTGLRPFIDPLSPADKDSFLEAYLGRIEQLYPKTIDGRVSYQICSFYHGYGPQIHYVDIKTTYPNCKPPTRHCPLVYVAYTMPPWIHPHLTQSVDPIKGRQLQASSPIQRGEVLLIDPPYAIIPTTAVDECNTLLCSNPYCNRHVVDDAGTRCPNRCIGDVIWCDDACRGDDRPRHEFECLWLSKYANSIRSKWSEYTFGMLWIIVRILARRQIESSHPNDNDNNKYNDNDNDNDTNSNRHTLEPPSNQQFKSNWPAINSLCGTPETWSHAQVREWTILVKKYLSRSALPHNLPNPEVLGLICKEEANSFGLYPRETGIFPIPSPAVDRGEQFGAAVYPRASIANHSCAPNITHKPDQHCQMVFTATRDIAVGQECCISYFDMTQYVTIKERREHLQGSFRFKCGCARCVEEEDEEESEAGYVGGSEDQWDTFPGMD